MVEKAKLDLPIILPEIPDAADACVSRLLERLRERDGITEVHVISGIGDQPARLCIHYDPEALPLPRIRELAMSAGAQITSRFGHALLDLPAATHQRHARLLGDRLRSLPGVVEAEVSAAGKARVEFDRDRIAFDQIRTALAGGAPPPVRRDKQAEHVHPSGERSYAEEGHEHLHGAILGANTELIFALVCGALLGIGFAAEKLVASAPGWLPLSCYLAAYLFGGFFTVREAIGNLLRRRFEIDTLMLVAAIGAAALGAWAEGALLLFLFSLAFHRANQARLG